MPNTREKLIELLAEHCSFKEKKCVGCDKEGKYYEPMCKTNLFGKIADHLIANGVTVRKWIPVTERLHKGGEIVLCNTKYFFEVLQWDERADMWVDQYRSYRKNYVTHWMPLPQPPKENNNAQM